MWNREKQHFQQNINSKLKNSYIRLQNRPRVRGHIEIVGVCHCTAVALPLPMIYWALFNSIFPLGAWRDQSYTDPYGNSLIIQGPTLLVLQHETIAWNQVMLLMTLFGVHFDNSITSDSPLCLCLYFWLNHMQRVSLLRLLFLQRQVGTPPGFSLRFVNSCLVTLDTNVRENTHTVDGAIDVFSLSFSHFQNTSWG